MAFTFAPVIASLSLRVPPHWLGDTLDQPIIRSLGWALAHSLWQIAAVSIVAAIVLRMLRGRSSNARYLAGCVAMIAMVVAPAMTLAWLVAQQPARAVRPAPSPTAFVVVRP